MKISVYLGPARAPAELLALIVDSRAKLAVAGVGIGLVGAAAVMRLLPSRLFGVEPGDPPPPPPQLLRSCCVQQLLACGIAARHACRIDLKMALRVGQLKPQSRRAG